MTDAASIAVSGLQDAVLRVATAAKNIANSSTTGRLPTAAGEKATSYTPQDVVTLSQSQGKAALGVTSTTQDRDPAYEPAYDPSSPDANDQGIVAAPNVDLASEIVTLRMASLTYEANAAVIKATRENDKKLMDSLS